MNALHFIRKHCNCCITGQPLQSSKYINVLQLNYKAEWKYPVWSSLESYALKGMAVAYFHDDCYINGEIVGEVRYAVEVENDKIIYHPLSTLIRVDLAKGESVSPLPIPGVTQPVGQPVSELLKISNLN